MRKRRLDRAIVLGLILSTSIYGTSFAADTTIEEFKKTASDNVIHVSEDTTVNGTAVYATDLGDGLTENTLWENIENRYKVQVDDGKSIIFNNVNMYVPEVYGNGDITININKSANGTEAAGIATSGIINANNLTINVGKDTDGKPLKEGALSYRGINTAGNNVYAETLNGNNVTVDATGRVEINSYDEAAFTSEDVDADISISAGNGIVINTDTRNGIYNAGKSIKDTIVTNEKENSISLKTTGKDGNIEIYSSGTGRDTAGVKNKNAGNVLLTATNGNIYIGKNILQNSLADNINSGTNTNGIYSTLGYTKLEANNINIFGKTNAVYNEGTGTIEIISKKPGVSPLADYDDYNNILVAEENGIKSDWTGSTTVEADNNNIIAGDVNGILSNDAGTIDVTAGKNNTIGQYTDESENVYTSEIGINAIEGTITVTAENGQNSIYGEKYGIRAGKDESSEKLESSIKVEATKGNNVINVKGFYDSNGFDKDSGDGINVTANSTGTIALTANKGNNEINAIDDGIYVDTGSTKKVTLTAENNTITAGNNGIDYRGSDDGEPENGVELLEIKATTGANIIKAGVSKVLGNPVGTDDNEDGYRDDKDGDGIRTQGINGTVEVTAGTYNDIAVRDTGLYIDDESDNSKISLTANGTKEETENYSNRISA